MRRSRALLAALLALIARSQPVRADASLAASDAGASPGTQTAPAGPLADTRHAPPDLLAEHLVLLAQRRLSPPAAQSVDELEALLLSVDGALRDGRRDAALTTLLEAVEGPRYRSFEALDAFASAELVLSKLLLEQGALASAQRSVDRLLARGVDAESFGPAYRRAVDIALARGDYAASADALASKVSAPLPSDAASELHYLRALAAYDVRERAVAQRELAAVARTSRFYASARYLLGGLAAAQRDFETARAHFTAVRDVHAEAPVARLDTAQLFAIEDAARLGLARVAHEQGRTKEALDHYLRISADASLLAEALFEAAYTTYERGRHDLALDALAQLEARYPHSPYSAEARVLRGYVHLGRGEFELAERALIAFEETFGPLARALDEIAKSPSATRSLFTQRALARPAREMDVDPLLLGLLARDPQVERLRERLAQLDRELARTRGLGATFEALAARARGGELPAARASDDQPSDSARAERLSAELARARQALVALSGELRLLRAGRAKPNELAPLEQSLRALRKRGDAIETALRGLRRARKAQAQPPTAVVLGTRFDQEQQYVAAVRERAEDVRQSLERALAAAEQRALSSLRQRLHREIRRARIGRIDAVMGKKRKRELEIESLAAGRFPPELTTRKRAPTLLHDDEEYWPFEGEDWPDEHGELAR